MDGDDAIGDGSIGNPYQTLQQAVDAADPGDVITLRQGTYAGGVTIHEPNITVTSYDGEWAKLVAPIDDPDIHQVLRFHYTADGGRIANIELEGGFYYAVKLETNWDWGVPDADRNGAENIVIENSKIHGSGRDAIKVTPGSDDLHVLNNEIYDTGLRYSGNAEGIDNVNGDRMIVRGNYIHDIATNGIYPKGGSIGSVIEGNLITNTGNGGIQIGYYTDLEWFDTYQNPELYEAIDTVVRNNIIVNTYGAGIGFWASQNSQVHNNTLVNVGEGQNAGVFFSFIDHYTSSNDFTTQSNQNPTFVNNIVVQSETSQTQIVHLRNGSVQDGVNFDNNIWFDRGGDINFGNRLVDPFQWRADFSEWQADMGGANSLEADPLLDASLHLTANSPAIDIAQQILALTTDYDGNIRSGLPDIGADEFAAGPSLPVPPAPGTVGSGSAGGAVLPAVHFSAMSYQIDEAAGFVTVTIERSNDVTSAVSVDYETVDLDAVAGSDFVATSGTLNFAAGQHSATFTVPITDDSIDEGQHSFRVQLSNPSSGVILGAPSITTVNILDDDHIDVPGTLEFTASQFSFAENAGVATVTVQRTGGSDGTVSVDWSTIDGTALAGMDYTASSGTVTLANGQTSATFTVPLLDDSQFEGNEAFTLTLANVTGGAAIGSQNTATVELIENETPPPAEFQMAETSAVVSEDAGTLQVVIERTGDTSAAATVDVIARSVSGGNPAWSGSDYQFVDTTVSFAPGESEQIVSVALIDDDYAEFDESFRLILTTPSGDNTIGTDSTTVVTIQDDQSVLSLSNWQYVVDESDGQALVTIQRVGNTSGSATVDYSAVNLTAQSGTDYQPATGTLSFAPGETEKTVTVDLVDDSIAEPQEQFGFSLSNVTGDSEPGRNWAYIVVGDDDSVPMPGVLQFAASSISVDETAGSVIVELTRTDGSSGAVSVDYATIDGTAQSGSDYVAASGTLTFAEGQTSATVPLQILSDEVAEGSESFSLLLSNPTGGATLGGQDTLTVTLTETPPTLPQFELTVPGSVSGSTEGLVTTELREDDGAFTFLVTRSGDSTTEASVTLLVRSGGPGIHWSQRAYNGQDYSGSDQVLTFAAGEVSKTIQIPIVDDNYAENDEFFNIQLVQPSSASELGQTTQALVTVHDDQSAIELASWQTVHNEASGTVSIVIRRIGDLTGTASVDYATINSSAISGEDFVGVSGTLTFAPGESEKIVEVSLIDDAFSEDDELFGFLLQNVTGPSDLRRNWQNVVIESDD